jgi:membrane protein YdbS with pleckstrin-like domain
MPDLFVSEDERKNIDKKEVTPLNSQPGGTEETPSEKFSKVKNEGIEDFEKRVGIIKTEGSLSSFSYLPEHVNFENKDPEEKIILFLRRHPITNLPWICITFILIILPAFLTVMPFFDSLPPRMGILFVMVWYLMTMAYVLEKFLDWFFSVDIITDERIVEVDFYNLITRKMTDTNINRIQDVTVQHIGGIRAIFNFGDVLIQTAAEIPEIDFEAIPEPDKVAKVLRELRVEEEIEKLDGGV